MNVPQSMFTTNILLSQHSSYKIGGVARYFAEPKSIGALELAIAKAHAERLPVFVLGGGTNLVIADHGFPGLVVKPAFKGLKAARGEVNAGASVSMEDLLLYAVVKGLSGLEWAGGLPGTLGGAIRGNAGAFGGEIKDVIHTVTSLQFSSHPRVITRTAAECAFGYRTSIFKEGPGKEIILSATLRLTKGDPQAIQAVIDEKIRYRKERHPMEYPNVGSIFKNVPLSQIQAQITPINSGAIRIHLRSDSPRFDSGEAGPRKSAFVTPFKNDPVPVIPTAHLIAAAGLKGVIAGGAMVSPKHPNFIVNALSATAEDVKALIRLVKATVKERFGITLEEEVIYV